MCLIFRKRSLCAWLPGRVTLGLVPVSLRHALHHQAHGLDYCMGYLEQRWHSRGSSTLLFTPHREHSRHSRRSGANALYVELPLDQAAAMRAIWRPAALLPWALLVVWTSPYPTRSPFGAEAWQASLPGFGIHARRAEALGSSSPGVLMYTLVHHRYGLSTAEVIDMCIVRCYLAKSECGI